MTNHHYYRQTRTWNATELDEGIWVSLGTETPDGITETTPRKRVTLTDIDTPIRFDGPFTFDTVVVARRHTGNPLDILHNGNMHIAQDEHAELGIHWKRPLP